MGRQNEAKQQLQQAKDAMASGDAVKAMTAANGALRTFNEASLLAPPDAAAIDYKAKYEVQLKEVKGYVVAYEKNVKAGQGKDAAATLDRKKFDGLVHGAEALAAKGEYEAANKNLTQASAMITSVLALMLDSATVVYEKNFSTPQEEYEYELARYESFKELVPIAIEQKQPSAQQRSMLDELVKKAERIVAEGKGFADRGDYTTAIQAMQAATSNVERGLMLVGVR
jgi:hypothetical protein